MVKFSNIIFTAILAIVSLVWVQPLSAQEGEVIEFLFDEQEDLLEIKGDLKVDASGENTLNLGGLRKVTGHLTLSWDVLAGDECPPEAVNIINPVPGEPISIPPLHKCLCNPGAVGQPRDADPRASWAILDTLERTFTVHRTDYDIQQTIIETKDAGLPEILGTRLMEGL